MATDSEKTRRRYDRIAPFFDALEGVMEGLFFSRWRKLLWSKAQGPDILEVGVGTGKNFSLYPKDARITAIDFSPKMLEQARKKNERRNLGIYLEQMDVESLSYADNSFDTVIATFVFCSVPKPKKGLQELYRVCKPGGQVLLLEHVQSSNRFLAALMKLIKPPVQALFGADITRQTLKSVQACPFQKVQLDPTSGDIIKLIRAVK